MPNQRGEVLIPRAAWLFLARSGGGGGGGYDRRDDRYYDRYCH